MDPGRASPRNCSSPKKARPAESFESRAGRLRKGRRHGCAGLAACKTCAAGTLAEDCAEGELAWVEKQAAANLPIWEGDRIFLRFIEQDAPFFSLKLVYQGDRLVSAALNGEEYRI